VPDPTHHDLLSEFAETQAIPKATRVGMAAAHRTKIRRRWVWGGFGIALLVAVLIWLIAQNQHNANLIHSKRTAEAVASGNGALATQGVDLAGQIARNCGSSAGRAKLAQLGISCAQAQHLATATPSGPAGPAGPQGVSGPQGPQGIPGQQGVPGATGPRGPEGPSGASGQNGVGQTGPAGAAGSNGNDGAQGSAGPAGPQGSAGPAGPQGDPGQPGATGPSGPSGPAGPDECADQGGTWTQQPQLDGGTLLVCSIPPSPTPTATP
jgi:hypothetical protein